MIMRIGLLLAASLLFAIPAGANPVIFVTNCCQGGSSVSVVSTTTNKEVAGIAVQTYAIAAAVSPDGKRAYAANSGSNTISVINTATHRNIGTIGVPKPPMTMVVSPDSRRLYLAVCTAFNQYTGCVRGAIDVVDVKSGSIVAAIQLNSPPFDLKFTPDGSLLVVAANPALVEIDPSTNSIVRTIHARDAAPQWVVITPDSKSAFTGGSGIWSFDLLTGHGKLRSSSSYTFLAISPDAKYLYGLAFNLLDTISTTSFAVVGSVPVGELPTALVLSPNGNRAYVPDDVTSSVFVVDVVHEQLVAHADVAYLPAGMAITPDGRELYVTNSDSSTISELDGTTFDLLGQTEAGARPRRAAITPDGSRAYVANWLGDTVSLIDVATISKVGDIDVGYAPYDVKMSPDGRFCYVNIAGVGVKFIDTSTNRVVASLHFGSSSGGALSDLAVSPDGKWLYALYAQQGFEGIQVIDTGTRKLAGRFAVSPIDGLSTMGISPDGKTLYVTAYFAKAVDIVDVASRRVTTTIPVPDSPEYVATSPDGKRIYVVIYSNVVAAIDLRSKKIAGRVDVPEEYGIGGIAVSADGSRIYATGSSVFAINAATMKVVQGTGVGAVTWGVTATH